MVDRSDQPTAPVVFVEGTPIAHNKKCRCIEMATIATEKLIPHPRLSLSFPTFPSVHNSILETMLSPSLANEHWLDVTEVAVCMQRRKNRDQCLVCCLRQILRDFFVHSKLRGVGDNVDTFNILLDWFTNRRVWFVDAQENRTCWFQCWRQYNSIVQTNPSKTMILEYTCTKMTRTLPPVNQS